MKKYITLVLLLFTSLLFISCGSDDVTPENPEPKVPLEEIIGKKKGLVSISLSPGDHSVMNSNAEMWFQDAKHDNKLGMVILKPEAINATAIATDFRLDKDNYYFTIPSFEIVEPELIGQQVPQYIRDWFPTYTISKVTFDTIDSVGDAVFSRATKTITLTLKGKITVYVGETALPGHAITYTFTDLINK